MTQSEIYEFNNLCARFLGWARIGIKSRHFPKGTWVDESEVGHCADKGMRFHLDWNWIMQVIDKMEEIGSCTIMGCTIKGSFEIKAYSITYYYGPEQNNLLQLQLKPFINGEPWKHPMYKEHIIEQFDFKNKTKLEAVVYAIHLFLTWYNEQL